MKKYWFKNKKIGIGLEPATWQGWLITIGFFFLIGVIIIIARVGVIDDSQVIQKVVLPILSITFLYVAIVFRTGEKIILSFWKKNKKDSFIKSFLNGK